MATTDTGVPPKEETSSLGATSATPRVLQLICPTGFYGAERWILALARNTEPSDAVHMLAVTRERGDPRAELADAFAEHGGEVFEIDMAGRFDVRAIGRLAALIKAQGVDVVHTHGYKSDLLGVLAAVRAGVASVCTPHGFENTKDLKLRAFIALGCRSFRFFDRVAPLSETLCNDVARYGVPADRIRYIGNGVDLRPMASIREERDGAVDSVESAPPNTLGFVGQLISRKNIDGMLDVFARIVKVRPETQLHLIGDGEERERLEALVSQHPWANQVQFLGYVDNPLQLMAGFDVFIMTSRLEGIPRCLMEAMALDVPIAAYEIPGVDQLIENNTTGLLAPMDAADTLAEACCRLLDDAVLRASIVDKARMTVERDFSAARMSAEYAALYDDVLVERS